VSRHLPAVSGRQLLRALQRVGFVVLRQKGSHISMEKRSPEGYWRTIIPMHREVRPGTLSDILHQSGLTKEQLRGLL